MNCYETRTCLIAFLDSELDRARSLEVQRHLDKCCRCAREAEIEREIRRALVHATPGSAPSLQACVQQALRSATVEPGAPRGWLTWRPARRTVVGSLATLMLLGLLAGLYSVIRVSANKPLADVLVEDLQAVWSGRNPLTISTDDPDEVGRWIRQTAGWDVAVTSPAESARLLGARSCELNGRRAIFVLYDVQKQPVSLVVLSDALTELAGMKPMHARSDCYVDRCKGYTVVAVRRGGLAHVAVGRLPEEQLMRLLDVPVDTKL